MLTGIIIGNSGNGNSENLQGLIKRKHLKFQSCRLYYSLAEIKKSLTEVGDDQIYSLDMPPFGMLLLENKGPERSRRKTFKVWTQ
jgi:hypothetical protein